MTTEQIISELDKMYANPKSRNFINHLVRAYIPVTKVSKVFSKPNGIFKCAISGVSLVCIDEIMEGVNSEEYKEDFLNYMKNLFSENKTESPLKKLVADKKLGLTGFETTTFLSQPAYQVFYKWVVNKAFEGDKHISWLLGNIKRSSLIIGDKTAPKSSNSKTNSKQSSQTFTLGESNDILSKLKTQLENNGQ